MSIGIRNKGQLSYADAEGLVRACRRLWASVVRTAADDLHNGSKSWDPSKRYYMGSAPTAAAWFASPDDGIGSFEWCCDVLDLNAQAVRRAISDKRFKKSHGQYANLIRQFTETREHDETSDQEM